MGLRFVTQYFGVFIWDNNYDTVTEQEGVCGQQEDDQLRLVTDVGGQKGSDVAAVNRQALHKPFRNNHFIFTLPFLYFTLRFLYAYFTFSKNHFTCTLH